MYLLPGMQCMHKVERKLMAEMYLYRLVSLLSVPFFLNNASAL